MNENIKVGLSHTLKQTVEAKDTAHAVGNEGAHVFSTPAMLLLIENCCAQSIGRYLPDEAGSVGISADFKHLAATPVGMGLRCSAEIIEVDRNRIKFAVEVHDDVELAGKGYHERFVVGDMAAFMARVNKKSTSS